MTHSKRIIAGLTIAAAASLSSSALAAGFQLNEQSVAGMGRSYAGEGIMGDDLSAAWYNPAGMTLLPGTQLQIGGYDVEMDLSYKGESGAQENGRKRSSPLLHQFITHQFNDKLWGGMAIVMPYGLSTSFDPDWEGAERGYDARLLTITLNPSLAWKVSDKLSLGAGFQAQHIDATISMKKNVMGASAYSRLEATDWAYGWNVGAMWSPSEKLRFGFGYRSQMNHSAHGHVDLSVNKDTQAALTAKLKQLSQYSPAQLSAMLNQTGLSMADAMSVMQTGTVALSGGASMKSPANANLTFVYEYSPKMRISGSLRWTDWSSLGTLGVTAGSVPHEQTDVKMNWRDTWFASLGYDLDITPKWTIRGGLAYDRSPIRKAEYRTALVPDANRLWASLGATYRLDEHWQFDLAALHVHAIGNRDIYSNDGKKLGRFDKLNSYLFGAGIIYRF